ncbi:MAG: TolC family protein, partial [Opitutus sp.]
LILDKARVKRNDFYRDYVAKQRQVAEDKLSKKVIAESEIFNIRLSAERAQISAEQIRFNFENDKASFARLTGGALLKDEEIPDEIPPVPAQADVIQRLLAGFLAQKDPPTNEAEIFRQSLSIEKLNLASQKTRLRPKFNLIVGTSQDEQSYKVTTTSKYRVQSVYGGVSVYWSIFDGFATGATVRSARAKVRQMESNYRVLTERLAREAQNQAQSLSFTTRQASISDRLYEAGRSGLRTRQEDFKRGVISDEDVGATQIATYDTEYNALASRSDYYNQLGVFLGTVTEDPVLANLKNQ